jgi:hypothetical protein
MKSRSTANGTAGFEDTICARHTRHPHPRTSAAAVQRRARLHDEQRRQDSLVLDVL